MISKQMTQNASWQLKIGFVVPCIMRFHKENSIVNSVRVDAWTDDGRYDIFYCNELRIISNVFVGLSVVCFCSLVFIRNNLISDWHGLKHSLTKQNWVRDGKRWNNYSNFIPPILVRVQTSTWIERDRLTILDIKISADVTTGENLRN